MDGLETTSKIKKKGWTVRHGEKGTENRLGPILVNHLCCYKKSKFTMTKQNVTASADKCNS
uniref:ORF X protein n=1 Tax=Caprine arthritis encephalitis virus TaxID=11660 RepID=Q65929_CAEV|nr:ORF X [Caprine arthritis encephalitis virus]prf//2209405C ORF X [Caprine arthritis encephalitis virus]